jgi:hypothetical protein
MNELTHLNWNSEVEREVAVGLDKKVSSVSPLWNPFYEFFFVCVRRNKQHAKWNSSTLINI